MRTLGLNAPNVSFHQDSDSLIVNHDMIYEVQFVNANSEASQNTISRDLPTIMDGLLKAFGELEAGHSEATLISL